MECVVDSVQRRHVDGLYTILLSCAAKTRRKL